MSNTERREPGKPFTAYLPGFDPNKEPIYDENTEFMAADGEIYCVTCGMPRRGILRLANGSEVRVPIVCDCRAQEAEEQKRQMQQDKMAQNARIHRDLYMQQSTYRSAIFDRDDGRNKAISDMIKTVLKLTVDKKCAGKGIILQGPHGSGKTFLVCCAANYLIDKGFDAQVILASEAVNRMLDTATRPEFLQRVRQCDMMVLDDVNDHFVLPGSIHQLYEIINMRRAAGKTTWYTTAFTSEFYHHPPKIWADTLQMMGNSAMRVEMPQGD